MSEDPFKKYKKVKDPKKRDFVVKQLKKEREELYFERQRQLQDEDDQEEVDKTPIARAQAVVIVKNSYLTQSLSSMNKAMNQNLPTKWSKRQHEAQQEEEDDDDDDDDDDVGDDELDDDDEDEERDVDDEDEDDNDDNECDDEADEDCENVYHIAQQNKIKNSKSTLPYKEPAMSKSKKKKGGNNNLKNKLAEETDDDDENEHQLTNKRVVQIIEAFNQVEYIDQEETNDRPRGHSHDYQDAKTIAPKSMREQSRSPHLTSKSPRSSASDGSDTILPPLELNHKDNGHKQAQSLKQWQDLENQLIDLDITPSLVHRKPKEISEQELSLLPHPDELDTGVWWKYLLDHATTINRDGSLRIDIVKYFPPASQHDIPEEYFHLPRGGRKEQPEKPLTAFGLFKKHCLDQDKNLVQKFNHSKEGKKLQIEQDEQFKRTFHELSDDELIDYHFLALIEKIRYKCQRVEYIYRLSTEISHNSGKKERSKHSKD
jgi:hypothetical protein